MCRRELAEPRQPKTLISWKRPPRSSVAEPMAGIDATVSTGPDNGQPGTIPTHRVDRSADQCLRSGSQRELAEPRQSNSNRQRPRVAVDGLTCLSPASLRAPVLCQSPNRHTSVSIRCLPCCRILGMDHHRVIQHLDN